MCGGVTDFEVPDAVELDLERTLDRVAKRSRFTVRTHRLDLVGTCSACS
jgi:Fe2+ or Zn2+ uptake regulation protein